MKRKILSILLTICVIVSASAIDGFVVSSSAVSQFAGGTGTQTDPYRVATAEQLNNVRNNLSAYYIQTSDIDLKDYGNWAPIASGYKEEVFSGEYDGCGHSISGLTIKATETATVKDEWDYVHYYGLFGVISGTVKRINLLDINIHIDVKYTPKENESEYSGLVVGGIAGQSEEFPISNSSSSGSIIINNAMSANVGGIVGFGTVNSSTNKTDITVLGKDYEEHTSDEIICGGITGEPFGAASKMEKCVNYGNVDVTAQCFCECGGITGEYGLLDYCVNYGNIKATTLNHKSYRMNSGNNNVGGISGYGRSVHNSINFGDITAVSKDKTMYNSAPFVGGVIGCAEYYNNMRNINCYNYGESIKSSYLDDDEENYIGRIIGWEGYYGYDYTDDLYSIESTTLNGKKPTNNIGKTLKNGASLSKAEIENKSKYILKQLEDNEDVWTIKPNPSEQKPTYTNWPFSNSRAVFDRADVGLKGHTDDCSGYYITANDYKKLMIGLGSNVERRKVTGLPRYNSIERDRIRAEYEEKNIWFVENPDKYSSNNYNVEGNSKYYKRWGGSCYGMVVLGQLLTSNALDISNSDYLTNDIGKLEVPSHAVISAINFYHHTQKASSIQSAASAYAKKTQEQKISDLIKYGNIANQAKKPMFIMIDWYSYDQEEGKWKLHGHAITGYGYEIGDFEVDGNHYSKRILISDVSADDDERAHLYINDDNEIYIPSHGFKSTTTEMEKTSTNNGRITYVSNDTNDWNVVDYITGESHINNSANVNTVVLPENGDAEISADAKEWLYKDGYVLDDSSGQLVLLFDKLAAEENSDSVTVVMPKGSNYGIKSNTSICADISTSDYYYSVQSNKPGKIDVSTSGTGSVSLNNKGSYLIDITANDGCLNIPWDDISIFGEGSNISFENSEGGLIINSDDFSNTKFFVSNDEEEIVFEIDTEKKSILLSEKDGEIAVYEAEKSQEGSKNIIENKKETPINNNSNNGEKAEVSKSFADVKTPSWYSDAVYYCRDKGYMAGKSNNKFDPNGTVTRATITQVLYAMEGKPAVKKAAGFKDLKSGSWYVDSVNWAASIGIVSGYSKDKFGPNDAITRQQMAAIMYQYAKYKKYDTSANGDISKFKDSGSITKYAVTPMKWAVGHGIISGTNKGLEPKGTATRAQIAVILQAFDKNIKK